MTENTWQELDQLFEEFPFVRAGGVPYEEIDTASQDFGFPLPNGYREFIHRHGGAIVGAFSVYGIGASKMMGNNSDSVFKVTDHFRAKDWPGVADWLIISMDHAGNPVGMDRDGRVWISDVVHGCIDPMAEDFEGYLVNWCFDTDDDDDTDDD